MNTFPKMVVNRCASLSAGLIEHRDDSDSCFIFKLKDAPDISGAFFIHDKSRIGWHVTDSDLKDWLGIQYQSVKAVPDRQSIIEKPPHHCSVGSLVFSGGQSYIAFELGDVRHYMNLSDYSVTKDIGRNNVLVAPQWTLYATDDDRQFQPVKLFEAKRPASIFRLDPSQYEEVKV